MKFKLWLENTGEECGLIRNVIATDFRRDSLLVLADWLEENQRVEADWIRSLAATSRQAWKVPPDIRARYMSGITLGARAPMRISHYLCGFPSVDSEVRKKLAQEWDQILQSENITLDGDRIHELIQQNVVILFYNQDVWMVDAVVDPGPSAHPEPRRLEPPVDVCWMGFIALARRSN